jgi:hypothetical protein
MVVLLAVVVASSSWSQTGAGLGVFVRIVSPTNGTAFRTAGTVPITAQVTRGQSSASQLQVNFYQDANLIASTSNLRFVTVTWQATVNWQAQPGTNYHLLATARDNFGYTTTSQVVRVSVNSAPTVRIVSPTNSQTFLLGSSVLIEAESADTDGTVTNLQFFSGDTLLGRIAKPLASATFLWTNLTTTGSHKLTARAQDNLGVMSTSAPVAITINAAPLVQILSPTNETVIPSQGLVKITAEASDSDGQVINLQFFSNGSLLGETDYSTNRLQATFDWPDVKEGTYDLSARATDDAGQSSTSAVVRITVLNATPTIRITSPGVGAELLAGGDLAMAVQAEDRDGSVTNVWAHRVFAGSTNVESMFMASTNTWTWTWTNLAAGHHELSALAVDNQGSAIIASSVGVEVLNALITHPTNNAAFLTNTDVFIVVELAPGVRAATVERFQGTNRLDVLTSPEPEFLWTNVVLGNYELRVWAANDAGLTTTSAPVHVTVVDGPIATNLAPQVSFRSGLLEQIVQMSNPTPSTMPPVRVWILDIPEGMQVFNATGFSNGLPFVQYTLPILSGETAELLIEYYVPSRTPPATMPRLVVESASPVPPPDVTGEVQHISREPQLVDGKFLLEFYSLSNRIYYVQYTPDLTNSSWTAAVPPITGSGNRVQWVDTGPPRTARPAAKDGQRFYRVILVP